METTSLYITDDQANDILAKLEAHLDDLLAEIRSQVVQHLAQIIESYKENEKNDDSHDDTDVLQPVSEAYCPPRMDNRFG